MKKIFYTVILLLVTSSMNAADSLYVNLNNTKFKINDTINFECNFKYENKDESKITLNIVIENIDKTKQWKFRYPLLQGYSAPALIIGKDIPAGTYAINILIQKDFLKLIGKVRDHNPKSKGFNYLMLGENKANYIGLINADKDGNFSTPKMLFEDTARFVFSEIGKKNDFLYIDLKTSIDSNFIPLAKETKFIQVGDSRAAMDTTIISKYKYDSSTNNNFTIKEVIVKSTKKKKIEMFDEAYSTGLFKFGFPTIFDGLETNEIGNSMDLFSYLQGRVAGLKISRDLTGTYQLAWRGGIVDVYLDEFKVDDDIASFVNVNDIAMIKVYPPLSGGPTGNGAIAIYTKRGAYTDNANRKYNFLVKGYSPLIATWE